MIDLILMLILGILLLLLFLILLLPVGVRIAFGDRTDVKIKVGPFYLKPQKAKQKPEQAPKRKKKREKKPQGEKKPSPKLKLRDVLELLEALWPAVKRSLRKVRKGIRVDPMEISVKLGGAEDPADCAKLYGYLNGIVWTAMPVLEKGLRIPNPSVSVQTDFDAGEHQYRGTVGVSARIGTLIGAGLALTIPALRWYLHFRKQNAAAAAMTDQKTAA